MTLKMLLRWKNPDASTDINLRLKDVAAKGYLPYAPSIPFVPQALGAEIVPVPFVLQVTVSPFVMVNYDGAIVTSDAISAPLTVSSGQINYIVCRARYVLMGSPILQMQVLTQAAYLADPELPWLVVAGVVDLSVGGPYTSVPTSRIFYEARDAVDEQTRSSWREPVANSGLLPIPPADHNRHGDVRLVTSTGSLYWWNDTASLWEIFDEVPLITHRDYEHTNGITGDSATGTLLPGVSGAGAGSNLTVAAVPAGSAYTVDGRLLQTPAAPLAILASSVGASRGLIRIEIDFLGTTTASYRASSGTANIDYARIVNMSDAHPAGLFTLDFTTIGGTLSWNNGPLVAVPVAPSGTRRYRLYRPNGIDWIEIVVNNLPAAPGINTNDIYTVAAPTDFETMLLVGYWFWDGSGAKPLIVGQDKRRFGNLAFPQMSTDFKEVQFNPPEAELRGDMVYAGGTCTSLGGLSLQITGPIISYIGGKRFETAAFFNGTAIPAASTRFIYVDEAGVLQIQVQDPATVFNADGRPLHFAEVARVVTNGVTFTTIEDRRDPQLIVGAATRFARVRLSQAGMMEWDEANKYLRTKYNGSTSGTFVETGIFESSDGQIDLLGGAGGLVNGVGTQLDLSDKFSFIDVNTGGIPQAITAPFEGDLTVLQPGNPTPSVFGTLHDLQLAKKFSLGVEVGLVPAIGAGTNVNIGNGTFYDALGRRISFSGTTIVPISGPLGDNVYAIVWDPDLGSGSFKSVNLTAGSGCDIQDLPFAVVVLNGTGTAISLLENVSRTADGQYDRSFVTVGPTAGFQSANFSQLRASLLHIMCFADSAPAPKVVRLVGNITEAVTAAETGAMKFTNAVGFPWVAFERLSNVKVVGVANTASTFSDHTRPVITWTSTSGPLIDFNQSERARGFGFQGVNFNASGAASITDHARCLFRNPGRGFQVLDASIDGNSILSHIVAWTDSVVDLGGEPGTVTAQTGVLFQRVFATQCVDNGGDAIFYFGDNTGTNNAQVTDINGRLTILDCVFECDATDVADFFLWTDTEANTNTSDFAVIVDKSTIDHHQRLFNNTDEAQKVIINSVLSNISIGISLNASRLPQIANTFFGGTNVHLSGAGDVTGCSLASACTLTIASTNRLTNCDFSLGTVTGSLGSIVNSTINLGLTGILAASSSSSSVWSTISNSTILKANDNANSNTMLSLATTTKCVVTGTQFVYTNSAITSTQGVISLTGTTPQLTLEDCTILVTGLRSLMTNAITATSTSDFRLQINGCKFDVPLGFLQVARAAGNVTGVISINDNVVLAAGALPIDIQNSTSGQMDMFQCKGNSFKFTAVDPITNIYHVKEAIVSNNVFYNTNGWGLYNFGGTTTTEGRQDSLIIEGNSFKGDTSSSKVDVSVDSYKAVSYENNTQTTINVAGAIATTYLQIGGQAFSENCVVSGNRLSCDHNGAAGTISDNLVIVSSFNNINVSGNTQYAGSLGGDVSAGILIFGLRSVVCSANNLLATQNVAGTVGLATTSINAQGAAAGEGSVSVTSNVMEASVGGSGSGAVSTSISTSAALISTIADNDMRSRQNGTASDTTISVADMNLAVVEGNTVRSSQNATITLSKTNVDAVVSSNGLHANNGTASIINWAYNTASVDENVIHAYGNIQIASGDTLNGAPTTAASASLVGNSVFAETVGGTVQLRASAGQAATAIGNAVRGSATAVEVATVLNGTNGATTVSGNSVSTTATGASVQLACYNAGSGHQAQITGNSSATTGATTAIIGGNATRGAIFNNITTGALVIANSAFPNTYAGGNNAAI